MAAKKRKKLTPKQRLFIQEYLIDLNATQACIRAGYSKKTAGRMGNENVNKPVIQEKIQEAMDERAERIEVDADYVLSTIVDTVERCKQAKQVRQKNGEPVLVETPDGKLAPAFAFDSSAVLKGCELLGRHLKLFTEKHEHTGKDSGPIENKWIVEIITPSIEDKREQK